MSSEGKDYDFDDEDAYELEKHKKFDEQKEEKVEKDPNSDRVTSGGDSECVERELPKRDESGRWLAALWPDARSVPVDLFVRRRVGVALVFFRLS